ncbi:hepatitis A virus cellular receptor 1 homolog isoform X2 [Vanacampus margaritifer]
MRGMFYLLLSILSQVRSEAIKVSGHIGHNVTLPCAYDAQAQGLLSFCWGRGKVPTLKCSNKIVYAEDGAVRFISESRYQLLGQLNDGDVSLTILNVQPNDAGVYGCRVELPGWFNDYKINIYLAVKEAPLEQPVTQARLPLTHLRHQGYVHSVQGSGQHLQSSSNCLPYCAHNHVHYDFRETNSATFTPKNINDGECV